jgi:polyisoprenoid-binding protein YceI
MVLDRVFRMAMGACRAALAFAGLAFAGPATALADIWLMDRNTSVVHFTYDHLGVSRQSGRFKDMEGRLEFSPTDPERGKVDVTIKAAGVSTGVQALDKLLRSVDFLDVARHPEIRFRSTAVRPAGEREGELDGELTFMGVTRPVTLKVRWNYTGEYPLAAINPAYQGKWISGFSASTVIQRSHWGVKRGVPLISDDVEIRIEAEFLRVD